MEREENSGLYEIRELASTAKKRIRHRRTSEHDVQESLLATASGLHVVALPEPGKEKQPELVQETRETPAVAPPAPQKQKRSPLLAFGVIGALAAAAAAGTFVYFGGLNKLGLESGASSAAKPAQSAKVDKPAPAPATAAAEAAPKVASLAPAGAGDDSDQPAADEAADPVEPGAVAVDSEPSESDSAEEAVAEREPAARKAAVAGTAERDRKSHRRERSAERKERPAKSSKPERKSETRVAAAGTAAGDQSLNSILDDVTGEVDSDKPAKEVKKAPAKKSLDRSDVARAMGAVRSRAGKCYEKEQVTGTVSVRFTVQPSGKLSGVSATGKHKGTATGRCVAAAVKSAHFPAFAGRPMTFTFPFLLAQ